MFVDQVCPRTALPSIQTVKVTGGHAGTMDVPAAGLIRLIAVSMSCSPDETTLRPAAVRLYGIRNGDHAPVPATA